MKDSYSFDVDDAGLERVVPGAPRRLHPHLRPARLRVRDRRGDVRARWAARKSEEFLAKRERRRGHLRPLLALRLRRQRRGGARPADRAGAVRRRARRPRRGHAGHADDRDARRPPQREVPPRRTVPGPRRTRSRTCCSRSVTPTARSEPLAVGLPGDREVDDKRLDAHLGEGVEFAPFGDDGLHRRTRRWPRATSAPARWGRRSPPASATWSTRASSTGTRWVTGADVAGSHVIDLVAGRDFTADGTIEAAEVRDGDPCPRGDGGVLELRRAASRSATSSSSAASTPRRSTSGCSTRTASSSRSRWAPTASARRARSRRSRRTPTTSSALAWPREVAPADVHLVATGKDEAIFAAAERLADELDKQGVDGPLRRPRRQGHPRGEVQGRRADRRPDHRRGRQGPGRRHRSRSRTARPAPARTSPPTTSSTTSSGSCKA